MHFNGNVQQIPTERQTTAQNENYDDEIRICSFFSLLLLFLPHSSRTPFSLSLSLGFVLLAFGLPFASFVHSFIHYKIFIADVICVWIFNHKLHKRNTKRHFFSTFAPPPARNLYLHSPTYLKSNFQWPWINCFRSILLWSPFFPLFYSSCVLMSCDFYLMRKCEWPALLFGLNYRYL